MLADAPQSGALLSLLQAWKKVCSLFHGTAVYADATGGTHPYPGYAMSFKPL